MRVQRLEDEGGERAHEDRREPGRVMNMSLRLFLPASGGWLNLGKDIVKIVKPCFSVCYGDFLMLDSASSDAHTTLGGHAGHRRIAGAAAGACRPSVPMGRPGEYRRT